MYKHLDNKNLLQVLNILNFYTSDPNYDIPEWHNVTLKILPKKGDISLPKKNYCPISLLDALSKVLSSILVSWMNKHLEKYSLKEQAGFIKARGCADATSTLNAADQDTFVLFVDIVKAFESVNREMLWKILKNMEYQKR